VNMTKESTSNLYRIQPEKKVPQPRKGPGGSYSHDLHIVDIVQQRLTERELCDDSPKLAARR
jgi:hypothetical protein